MNIKGLNLHEDVEAVESYAAFIREVYASAENIVLQLLSRYVSSDMELPEWASLKAAEIVKFRQEVLKETSFVESAPEAVKEAIDRAYRESVKKTVRLLRQQGMLSPVFKRNIMAGASLKALAMEKVRPLEEANRAILRTAEDAYRQVIGNVVAEELAYGGNRVDAAARALREFAERGVCRFVDSANRSWELESYAEMATRSAVMRAAAEGSMQTLYSAGFDLVIVSAGSESCPLCAPWEGQILSISGRSQDYTTVNEAIDAGLLHPNCTHTLDPYIEGLTTPGMKEEPDAVNRRYRERQTQRYLERNLRRWRRREAASITPDERRLAAEKVREWRGRLKAFVDDTGRKRWREREAPGRAR